jgi:peptidylprolyl isomerase
MTLYSNVKRLLLTTAIMLGTVVMNTNAVEIKDPENTLHLQLKDGTVTIQMFPNVAPNHVARVKELVREHYYDGKLWHRVMDGFMAQTGSPNGDGIGGSSKPDLKAEFNQMSHVRGVVSMARTSMPDTANAQFFIVLKSSSFLDGQYTAWGQVIDGMEFVDNIKKAPAGDPNGMVSNPDKIIKMTIVADENKQ